MEDGTGSVHVPRPWREIAEELTQETNQQRIIELALQLNRALEEEPISNKPDVPDGDATHLPELWQNGSSR